MEIKEINPWWKTDKVKVESFKRDLFDDLIRYINDRQIIAINGLRRVGKTVLMHHLIEYVLKNIPIPKENVFYYNFDLMKDRIENILKTYQDLLGVDIKKERIFVFLDEIQKCHNWENEIKALYDNYRNIKFIISGSSTLFIEKKTKESLGGRVYSFVLKPMTFKEYLKLKGMKFRGKNIFLFKDDIKQELKHYIRIGGFPELINLKDGVKIDRYIKELIIDRIVYIDIPEVFEIEEPELLIKILSVISAEPGMIIDYESLADDFGRNRKTISNYFFYLEKAFLINKLYNYSKNLLTSEKKLKKIYPVSTSLAYLYNADTGKIIEAAFLMNCDCRFFSRIGEKEVDFINLIKNKIVPIELKYKKDIKKKELKGMRKFLQDHKIKEGIVITDESEERIRFKNKIIKCIPLWKWLLQK